MNFESFLNASRLNERAAGLVTDRIEEKPDLLLCAATGSSPEGLYREMVRFHGRDSEMFRRLRVIKLDEWLDLPPESPDTCEKYLQTRLIGPMGMTPGRYISFSAQPADPEKEAGRIRALLRRQGPIDLCILGLGRNGHLGLNEPGPALQPECHVAVLSRETRQHPMVAGLKDPPGRGLTLGMRDILNSRQILLIVSGGRKEEALATLRSGRITTSCPATFLWLHPRVHCLVME